MLSPSFNRITKRTRSSITELSFQGLSLSPPFGRKSVTHVSGTFCYLCLGSLTFLNQRFELLGSFHFRALNPKTYQNRIKTPAILIFRIKTLSSPHSPCDSVCPGLPASSAASFANTS